MWTSATLNSLQVTSALGFTPYNSTNPSGYITDITSSNVTTALGYTPYNSTNPNGYITSSGSISGNAATATTFSTNRTNYKGNTDSAVAGQLMWKNYGNNHTLFDASNGTSPDGTSISRYNPANQITSGSSTSTWGEPIVLMGWNGSTTFGVKVDWSRYAESAGSLSGYNNPVTTPTASTIVYRDGNGDISAREITLSSGLNTATPTVLVSMYPTTNQLVRTTPAAVAAALSGQTMNIAGNAATATQALVTVTGTNAAEIVRANIADNDFFRIRVGGDATNAGWVEFATADDGTEPIYVRQYTGVFTSVTRTLTLLDGSGNSSFPGTITATKVYNSVYNDIADFVELEIPIEKIEYGKCYTYKNDTVHLSDRYCQKGIIGIASDTYGYGLGTKQLADGYEIPIAVAGFVLAYVDNNENLEIGDVLTSSSNGYLIKMSNEDKSVYPERILGTFFKHEKKDVWHDIKVNGRVWIKVK